jgi:hypothetical protein
MRSTRPLPWNPWPHDMVINVSESPNHIALLLFIRSAWGIAQDANIPALNPEPNAGSSKIPATAEWADWSARWERAWTRAWAWYDVEDKKNQHPTPELLRTLSQPDQPLHPAFPPDWTAEHGLEGVDLDAFNAWTRELQPNYMLPLKQHPERRCLPALIDAWKTGLDTILVMPYQGYYAKRISPRHLVVSAFTHNDLESYTRALAGTLPPG